MVNPGEKLGNYEVASAPDGSALILGSGAGGVTYRGRHVHLGTEVAIKVLIRRKNLLQKDRDAFLSEARAAASLTHPKIARILDFGESAQQHPYYVMELCEGGSLEEFGRNTRTPDEYACIQWFFESAAALAHAHQKGILHRDIKPSNLLVARENQTASVKLIDFGLADQSNRQEVSEQVIGTPHFAAPEQLRGQAEPASDVFSLGATFLWLLTGKHLSQGDVKSVISDRLESTGYAPQLATLPPAWRGLLGRMLEIHPAHRPRDGAEVMAAAQAAFPDHPGHPVPWDTAADSSHTGSNIPSPSHWQDYPETPWSALWDAAENPVPIEHGEALRARRSGGQEVFDVLRFSGLAPEIAAALTAQADMIARHAAGLGLDNVLLERGSDWWSVAWSALGTQDALSWVRQGRSLSTAEILSALDPIASALDGMHSSGFEHLEIHPSMLIVNGGDTGGASLAFSLGLPLPLLAADGQAADSASTMPGATGAGLSARFASCVYQLISGRTPPPASFVNARAYQAIPKLTERSNRFLASAIAGSLAGGTCRDVTRGLAHEERIPGASLSGALSSASSAGSRTSPDFSSIPQVTLSTPAIPVAAPTSVGLRPPVETKPKAPNRTILVITAPAVILLAAAIIYLNRKTPPPAKPPPPAPVADVSQIQSPATAPPIAVPAAASSLAVVRVPGDADTIAAGLALCEEGGTIEIAGGTFSEAVVLTKSISLVSKTAALFEDAGLGASLITARGPIQVTLRNIRIKNTQSTADKPLEFSPALVLLHDGSSVRFEGCVIEGSPGNGISFSDKASAVFSNCRVRKNRGYGINVTSGSKVELSLSEIQENGRSGISVMNVGSSVILGDGATVSSNSRNGVEVANGAQFHCAGAEIKSNTLAGLVVEGAGSTARLESSCAISGNLKFASIVRNSARLDLSGGTIEENGESGIIIESGGQAVIDTCRFRSNGKLGIQLSETSSGLTLTNSDFTSHTGAAALLIEGTSKVTACHFDFTPPACALVYGEAATGEATANTVNPGPMEKAIDGAGRIVFRDNAVKAAR